MLDQSFSDQDEVPMATEDEINPYSNGRNNSSSQEANANTTRIQAEVNLARLQQLEKLKNEEHQWKPGQLDNAFLLFTCTDRGGILIINRHSGKAYANKNGDSKVRS